MMQQMQTACTDCRGEGNIIAEKDKCTDCQGAKTVAEAKVVEFPIEAGMKHGDKIKFTGEGDQKPGVPPGDVIWIIQQKPHALFTRNGDHLMVKKKISLAEALTGFQFTIKHLDGRLLLIRSERGQVYRPGDIKGIENEGKNHRTLEWIAYD